MSPISLLSRLLCGQPAKSATTPPHILEPTEVERASASQTDQSTPYEGLAQRSTPILTRKKLPVEVLEAIINEIKDVPTINNARLVCRDFEKAAWPAFAKSFNLRVFHPTARSLRNLVAISKQNKAAPFLTTLNISTIRPWLYERDTPSGPDEEVREPRSQRRLGSRRRRICLKLVSFAQVESEQLSSLRGLLRLALQNLKHLKHIYVVDGGEIPRARPPALNRSALSEAISRQSHLLNMHAHNHTLQLVYLAMLRENNSPPEWLSQLRGFKTAGSIFYASIPSRPLHDENARPFPHLPQLTTLDIAVTDRLELREMAAEQGELLTIPSFITTFPCLTSLTLRFPRRPKSAGRQHSFFGTSGFVILQNTVLLRRLQYLHLANLDLSDMSPLCGFLRKHRLTLRDLELTSLRLPVYEWKMFIASLERDLRLDQLTMNRMVTKEERGDAEKAWRLVPPHLRLVADDYLRAAKKVRRIGTRGEDLLFAETAS